MPGARAQRADPGEAGPQIAVGVIGRVAHQPAAGKIGQSGLGRGEAEAKPDLGANEHRAITPDPTSGPQGHKSRPCRAVRPWAGDMRGRILLGELSQNADDAGNRSGWS